MLLLNSQLIPLKVTVMLFLLLVMMFLLGIHINLLYLIKVINEEVLIVEYKFFILVTPDA